MNVTVDNYVGLCLSKESILKKSHTLDEQQWRILHAALGIQTELGELLGMWLGIFPLKDQTKEQNVAEEIGDVLWYLAIICDELKIDFKELMISLQPGYSVPSLEVATDAIVYGSVLVDVVKRAIYYKEKTNLERALMAVHTIAIAISNLISAQELDLDRVMEANVAKLAKRYPKDFAEDPEAHSKNALDRDLKAEQDALNRGSK